LEKKEWVGGDHADGMSGAGWDDMSMDEKARYLKLLMRRRLKENNLEKIS